MSPIASIDLIKNLASMPSETEWIEFKVNDSNGLMIGRNISALANSAAYHNREHAYLVWGIEDDSRALVGTKFNYRTAKGRGGMLLTTWLRQLVSPNAVYTFNLVQDDGKLFVVLDILAASQQPVSFDGKVYLREGAATVELKAGSSNELELWRRLQSRGFEGRVNRDDVPLGQLGALLDLHAYSQLIGRREPLGPEDAIAPLLEQRLLIAQDDGLYSITNLAALLLARNLLDFEGLAKRPIRVIHFDGDGNLNIRESREFTSGYAIALPEAESFLASVVPGHEQFDGAFRYVELAYPRRALRELLSNAVIHQDLSYPYSGPLVNVYEHRIVFSNPGRTLVDPMRVLNDPPVSRNPDLARQLRLMGLCEEGGSGWDWTIEACEERHIPAPKMTSSVLSGTVVELNDTSAFDAMTRREQLDATYWHACLLASKGDALTNYSLRERFGLGDDSRVRISRLIKSACERGLLVVRDEDQSNRYREYLPVLP